MRHCLLISIILTFFVCGCSEKNRNFTLSEITILPKPASLNLNEGSFEIKDNLTISIESDDQKNAANSLINSTKNQTNFSLELKENTSASIEFKKVDGLANEAYKLEIAPNKIIIKATDKAGYFYAVQTIRQLLSEEKNENAVKWLIPAITIEDSPRFNWRAYMLDESRYFHGEEFVKQILDQMAMLKMNVFHWHLIDDAGWRIEIKKYPLLTEVGAFRKDSEIGTWKSGKTSGEPHGGFYTQEQIKDIVAYAAERNITIVPEFEMPGHSTAAIASYTWLGTAGIDIDTPVKFGRLYDNYDVTKPEVVQFIKDVLLEMFELFPSEIIHIGGDEVGYDVWEKSKSVQKYMTEHGINTPADLQIDFTNKISQFMEKNGRRMMGWNEILGKNIHAGFEEKKHDKEAETELAKNVVVHFWKGDLEMATNAAKNGYGIVNSLHSNTYLDYNYKSISLEKAYNFNPIPEGLEEQYHKNIYGLGCQMWSEWTPTNRDVERQTFPRIAAYAEVGWTQLENKDYESFKVALKKIQRHWDNLGINYFKNDETGKLKIAKQYYKSLDNSDDSGMSNILADSIVVRESADNYEERFSRKGYTDWLAWDAVFEPTYKILEIMQEGETVNAKISKSDKRISFLTGEPMVWKEVIRFQNDKIIKVERLDYEVFDVAKFVKNRDELVSWIDKNHAELSGFLFPQTESSGIKYLKAIELFNSQK